MPTATKPGKTQQPRIGRPKLADISLTRDLYAETVAALGHNPLPVVVARIGAVR